MNKDRLDKIQEILGGASSQRLRESFFKNKYLELYTLIDDFCKNIPNIKIYPQKLWYFVNDKQTEFLCKTCNINPTTFNKNWLDGYRPYCSYKCSATNQDTKDKREDTCKERYDVTNVAKLESSKEKQETTNIIRYNTKSSFQNSDVRAKYRKNYKEKTGYEHPFQNEELKSDFKLKSDKTKNEKYGDTNIFKTSYFKEISKNTREKSTFDKYQLLVNNNEYELLSYLDLSFKLKHYKCGEICDITLHQLYDRHLINNSLCLYCYPIAENDSIPEKEIMNFVLELGFDDAIKDKTILEGKELDIYIPSMNLAIEHNGLYYHNEKNKDRNYHLDKSKCCHNKGIHLLHIWGDEWFNKKEIIKSIIKNQLNKSDIKIYARKCNIEVIKDNKIVKNFLNDNHIQGFVQSNIKLGLYYNDELVSLMCFGSNNRNGNRLELLRFCNKLNTNVVGSGSKLFKYFLNNFNYDNIISFSDIRLYDGNLYKQLGFVVTNINKPDYYWTKDMSRLHKSNFTKKKLQKNGYDTINKTENEIMYERGYSKIFNCGQVRWEYKR
jgi:hypothetical protein